MQHDQLTSDQKCPGLWFSPKRHAFPILAIVLFSFFFAASTPSPLFVVFQGLWGFSSGMLTVAFGMYAITLMATLLVAGSLSDHIGRRPVIIGALIVQTGAMFLFLTASNIAGLIEARVLQGLATGIASGALSAAVVEAAPVSRKRLGALICSVAPLGGLAMGALVTGLSITWIQHPEVKVFGILAGLFPVFALLVAGVPESTSSRTGALASLMPRISISNRARPTFFRSLPALLVVWALCGLFMALAPSLMVKVFDVHSGSINGLTIAVLCGLGAVIPTVLGSFRASTIATVGLVTIGLGLVVLLIALDTRSVALFFIGAAIAGAGSGATFSAVVQSLAPLADIHERAELFAAIFVATYVSLSMPPIAAGFMIATFGFLLTTQAYLSILLVVAVVGAWLQWSAAKPKIDASAQALRG